jgi:dsDNA-binding SOS-regulon protein
MFVDYSKMNFTLKANADVFKKMPEFKAIPFDQMGVRNK